MKKKSWKTTLGGILAAIGAGMRAHPKTAEYSQFAEMAGFLLMGVAARDNGVTSEDAGAKPSVTDQKARQ